MPNWRKVIVSGSDAALNSLNVSTTATIPSITGSLLGTASWANNAVTASFFSGSIASAISSSYALTASYAINIRVSGSINNVQVINFATGSDQPVAEGRLGWDDGYGTLNLGLKGGNVNLEIGEELFIRVFNAEATTLTKGTVVYISGAQGNRVSVKRASAAAELGSANTLGFVAEQILSGAEGFVQTEGPLEGLNTIGLTAGGLVYLSSSAGLYTQTPPQAPLHSVRLGYVERVHATVGSIYVKIDNGYEIDELHDVLVTNPTNGDLLVRSGSLWLNTKQLTGSYVITGSLNATLGFTGSLLGTASWASNSISSSYALTSSFAVSSSRAISSSYALSASQAQSSVTANSATSATSAGTATGTSGQLLSKDDRVIEPNSITNAYLQFGFTAWNNNNAGPYADYLHMRSYIDGSGGNDNLVAFNKQQIGMRIWQQSFNSATAYADYRDVVLTSGSSTGYVPLWNGPYAISSSVIYQSGSNIGLGTITPTQRLEVSGNIKLTAGGFLYGDGSSAFLQLTNANGSKLAYGSNVYFEALSASANIRATSENITIFNNNGRIVLSGSGDVGIGTNNPQGALEIVKAITYSSIDTYPQLRIKNATGDTGHQLGFGVETGLSFIQSLNRGIGATPLILQRYAGNVGIGTATPNALLDVNGNAIVSGSLTIAPSNITEFQVASTGVKIGNTISDSHNVTGSLNTSGSMTLLGTFTQTPFKSIVIPSLAASATQAREFEILRGITDYNDWSPTGVVEIEVHEQQYGRGLKKTYAFSYGYFDSAEFKLVEMIGASTYNNFQLRMGSKTLISGDVYYYPIYAQVKYYASIDILIKTRRNITTNPVSTTNGDLYVNTAPTASNISDFTADSIVTLNNAASGVDVTGSLGVSGTATVQNLAVNGTNATFNTTNTNINSSNVVVGNDTGDLVGIAGNTMYFPGSGRVGIGTTVPSYKTHIVDSNNTTPFGVSVGSNAHYVFTGNSTSGYTTTFNINDTGLYIGHNSSGRSINLQTNNTDRLTILGGGNVGIGQTNPQRLLHIQSANGTASQIQLGQTSQRDYYIGIPASQTYFDIYDASAGASRLAVTSGGNVGIGTISPAGKLDVTGTTYIGSNGSDAIVFLRGFNNGTTRFQNNSGLSSTYNGLSINTNTTNANALPAWNFDFGGHDAINFLGDAFSIWRKPSGGSYNNYFTINSSGNVGIGTTTPGAKLDVNGNTIITGSLTVAPTAGNVELQVTSTGTKIGNVITDLNTITGSLGISGSTVIVGSLAIGTSSLGSTENTLVVGPSPSGGTGEGGQILLQATGGTYTSASMLDNYQNRFRILRGTNASSNAEYFSISLHTGQLGLSQYTGTGAFPGTATANLAVDSSGNVITVATGGGGGGSTFPFTGSAVITGSLIVTGSIGMPYTTGGLILVQDPLGVFGDASRYSYPQFRVPGYRTGITLTDNDEVHVVSNATSVFSTKLESTLPNIRLDSNTTLKWSTSTANGFNHDILLRRESPAVLAITGSVKVSNGVTGSLLGTASYANQALSASWAPGGSTALSFNRQTASYTLVLADAGKVVEMNVGSANNLTVPLNSSVAFPVGTEITITQYGAGRTTIVATSGVTLRSVNSWLKANGQYSVIGLLKVATDEWYVYGGLSA